MVPPSRSPRTTAISPQLRITRSGGNGDQAQLDHGRQPPEGHGSVAADTRTNRLYVNNLMTPVAGLSVYDLTTGKHITDVNTGIGTNSMLIFGGRSCMSRTASSASSR